MPRPSKTQKTDRLTVALPPRVRNRLEELRDETEADSITEVVRRALAVYDLMWQKTSKGSTVIVRDKSGKDTTVEFVWS